MVLRILERGPEGQADGPGRNMIQKRTRLTSGGFRRRGKSFMGYIANLYQEERYAEESDV
jgi:hypothetical protein